MSLNVQWFYPGPIKSYLGTAHFDHFHFRPYEVKLLSMGSFAHNRAWKRQILWHYWQVKFCKSCDTIWVTPMKLQNASENAKKKPVDCQAVLFLRHCVDKVLETKKKVTLRNALFSCRCTVRCCCNGRNNLHSDWCCNIQLLILTDSSPFWFQRTLLSHNGNVDDCTIHDRWVSRIPIPYFTVVCHKNVPRF